jgi:hypothetical protein
LYLHLNGSLTSTPTCHALFENGEILSQLVASYCSRVSLGGRGNDVGSDINRIVIFMLGQQRLWGFEVDSFWQNFPSDVIGSISSFLLALDERLRGKPFATAFLGFLVAEEGRNFVFIGAFVGGLVSTHVVELGFYEALFGDLLERTNPIAHFNLLVNFIFRGVGCGIVGGCLTLFICIANLPILSAEQVCPVPAVGQLHLPTALTTAGHLPFQFLGETQSSLLVGLDCLRK